MLQDSRAESDVRRITGGQTKARGKGWHGKEEKIYCYVFKICVIHEYGTTEEPGRLFWAEDPAACGGCFAALSCRAARPPAPNLLRLVCFRGWKSPESWFRQRPFSLRERTSGCWSSLRRGLTRRFFCWWKCWCRVLLRREARYCGNGTGCWNRDEKGVAFVVRKRFKENVSCGKDLSVRVWR